MKYRLLIITLISICTITFSFTYQTNPTFGLKTIKLIGTEWGNTNGKCFIDSIPVTCKIANKSYAVYKSKMQECTPCWLEIVDYNQNTISSGIAINIGNSSHHHYYFGKFTKYNKETDSLSTFIDNSYNIDSLLTHSPEEIRVFLKENKKYYY